MRAVRFEWIRAVGRPCRLRGLARHTALCMAVGAMAAMGGCATPYVDNRSRAIDPAQYQRPASAHPVQVLFEFQSKGVANPQVTAFLKTRVVDQVRTSGLFSHVSDQPVDGGALLSITLNNVVLTDDAFSKGFITGLTLGIAGSQVTDGYVCTARYGEGLGAATLQKEKRHAIHTVLGAGAAPANSTKAASMAEAVYAMTQQVLSQVLNELSSDPQFR